MSAAVAPAARTRERRGQRWLAPVALAVPFLIMVAALRGMTATLPIFHGTDEQVYQYPTILRFAGQLPFPDLHSYHAAQTPLFHLLMAYAGKVVGYQLWRLRLLQVLISYLLALATFLLLHRRLGMQRLQALALTLLFVLSPYVFGTSFRLLTDNLALLFVVLALERFERFRETDSLAPFVVGCGCVAAAMLTRQSTAFMLAVAAIYALRPGAAISLPERAVALGAVALSFVPVGLLFLSWHGLVPVGSDPSSCGLCAGRGTGQGISTGGLEMPSAELALATIGLYGVVLFGPLWISQGLREAGRPGAMRRFADWARGPLIGAFVGLLLLVAFPARPGAHAAGDFWKVAGHLPAIHGTSLLSWVLVPLAGAVLWARIRVAPRPWLAIVFAGCFLVSAVAIHYPWQKYVDPFALLVLFFTVGADELASWRLLAGAGILALAFLAYTLDFSSHNAVPHTAASTAAPIVAVLEGR
jgi:4-amino-4-deoxy-L-arabinose transferase-like glycosyltransferase